jgi:transposase
MTHPRLVWAAPGRDADTVRAFFDLLGEERSAKITHVTADAAQWISTALAMLSLGGHRPHLPGRQTA